MSARSLLRWLPAVAALGLLAANAAEAQWLLVGRAVVGRVRHMEQSQNGAAAPRYDVAIVVLDAPAQRVYDTVIATVAEHPDYKFLQRNDVARSIEVGNGSKSAGIQIVELDPTLSQLIIASVIQPGEVSPVPFALRNVLSICEKMHVTCKVDGQP